MGNISIKENIVNHISEIVEEKISGLRTALSSVKEARDGDTKSTAGDKHETGRAIMQRELEQLEQQLNNQIRLKSDLEQLDLRKNYDNAEAGSLVQTNEGIFYISVGLGKLDISGNTYFVISPTSPIGSCMLGKSAGDKISFQEREIEILGIE